jgi:hypothetical protein
VTVSCTHDTRRANTAPGINARITQLLDSIGRAADLIYVLKKLLYQSSDPTPADIQNAQRAATSLGRLFRSKEELALPVPPKLHLLESHAADQQMRRRFGRL